MSLVISKDAPNERNREYIQFCVIKSRISIKNDSAFVLSFLSHCKNKNCSNLNNLDVKTVAWHFPNGNRSLDFCPAFVFANAQSSKLHFPKILWTTQNLPWASLNETTQCSLWQSIYRLKFSQCAGIFLFLLKKR